MPTLDGDFTYLIPAEDLGRGLRPTKRAPRNTKFLTVCRGAVGLDGVLQVLDDLEAVRIDTSHLPAHSFPYPQLFVLTNFILVCLADAIYEYSGGSLNLVLGGLTPGIPWSVADFYDFLYMSNGKVAVTRTAEGGVWSTITTQPIFSAICNYNGQAMIGAPDVEQP